jgi:hypothetical protein
MTGAPARTINLIRKENKNRFSFAFAVRAATTVSERRSRQTPTSADEVADNKVGAARLSGWQFDRLLCQIEQREAAAMAGGIAGAYKEPHYRINQAHA